MFKPSIILLVLTTGALALGGAVLAQSAGAQAPALTISPLPGTPDAPPQSQISLLGAPISQLHDVLVRGSRSGVHSGKLEAYSTGNGASFIPGRAFIPGESVSVSVLVGSGSQAAKFSSSFRVGDLYTLPPEHGQPSNKVSVPTQVFHSRHDLRPPQVKVTTAAQDTALGDILISPDSGPTEAGPMIIEPSGSLLWFAPLPSGTEAMNLRVQRYHSQPVLTWWQGHVIAGHGQGEDVIYGSAYQRIAAIHGGNGLYADLHEFQITPQGTALLTAYEPVHYDLSSVRGSREGLVEDCAVQEIDISTGLVMFEWHALGHVPLSDSYEHASHIPSHIFDYFHINTVQEQSSGDLLIGSRNTWTVYLINGQTGQVLWRVGGKQSTFALGSGVRFAWQHDSEIEPDGSLSIFDNEDSPPEAHASRAIRVALNTQSHTATLLSSYELPGAPVLSPSQGNVQLLSNEDRFVGWGQAGYVSEFSPTGTLTFSMQLPTPVNSYRAYRAPWNATPHSVPALAVGSGRGTVVAYASWNGATEVSAWRLLAGASPGSLKALETVPRQGFETELSTHGSKLYVQAQALGASGQLLASSRVLRSP